jgi:3-oxoacyl-[acyl-carrier-protein] synthase-3
LHYPRIDMEAVQRFGETSLVSVIGEALQAAGTTVDGVDHYVIGHVLPEVAASAAQRLGVPATRISVPASRHGHLTAAALPVALSEDVANGTLASGATVCLAASGAGFCWGAAILTL